MSRPPIGHLEDEQLLRYADGESPARAVSEIRSHLEACWQCREHLEELQNTVGECVRYRKNILQRHLPEPPVPWPDIYRGFAEIDVALDLGSFRGRIARALWAPMRSLKIWVPVAVALMLVCLLLYRFRQTPSVQAAELLRKAVAAADAHHGTPRPIRIRTKDRSFTRLPRADTTSTSSIQALFRDANYDWDDPLSARSYQTWRDRLADKRDEVIEESGAYRIRTSTASGELLTATLKIRMQDLRPVEERFEFRNREWVEISEVPDDVVAPNLIASNGLSALSHNKTESAPATIGDELHVLAALHQAGADLGDPIEVSRSGGEILVAGLGISPQRQREIHDALSSQKRVVVRFSEAAPAQVEPPSEAATESASGADLGKLQTRMAEQIGGPLVFSQLAAQILDSSEPMMARVYALRRLAERIPVAEESALNAQDRQLLLNLQQEHVRALRRQTAEIDRLLTPVLGPVSPARAAPDSAILSGPWQPATEELFQSARQVDKLLAVMFGAATGETSSEQLPSQLLSSLTKLRAAIETYDHRLTQTLERR